MADLHDTHINVFLQDMEDAYKQALGAIQDFKVKADLVKEKLLQDFPGVIQAFEEDQAAKAAEAEKKK